MYVRIKSIPAISSPINTNHH